ncbi:Uncharacterized protein TCM_006864 [Theobroma cacao]|uniref:RNase H type-1 domain-containing protein n=1 Tax=Theobroma cacao TaxID=3641 RepID=A0A061E6S3_THECC|nr:Uncharacterized protein TCM_006864 [Theobroma cacao]
MEKTVSWKRPSKSWFKFKTDGATRDCSRNFGIEGVLRNDEGSLNCCFPRRLDGDANLAKVLAIREVMTMQLFLWANLLNLIIESDSSNAVTWMNKSKAAPWKPRHLIFQNIVLKGKVADWQIQYTPRIGNR